MNPALLLHCAAARYSRRAALMLGERVICDYDGFASLVRSGAGVLREMGLIAGDRVAVFAANCPHYLTALHAIWQVGCIPVPINAKLHPREVAWILENAEARHCFVSCGLEQSLAAVAPGVRLLRLDAPTFAGDRLLPEPHPMGSEDTAWLFYTSGTTGRPKGVMIPARALELMTLCYYSNVDTVRTEGASLYAAPMSHGAGLYCLTHVLKGARHVVPPSGGFNAGEILDLSRQLRNVSLFAAPTMVRRIVDMARMRGEEGDGIQTIVYGGGPMYFADILDAVETMGPRFVQIYGQGECPMAITALSREEIADRSHPRWRERLASVGCVQAPVELRIVREDGRVAVSGEVGEICVRSGLVMTGYWRNPDATASTLADGWLRTGDLGVLDSEGYLTLKDRSRDVIISGGTNIYPREVEDVLVEHPDVREVAVVGEADAEWGETVVAFVVPGPGITLDDTTLDAHCHTRIAAFKRPRRYVAVSELPKNNYGKVLKSDLRSRLAAKLLRR